MVCSGGHLRQTTVPDSQKPAAEIGCPLCGTPTRVDGLLASCPAGHEFDVIYGRLEDGTCFPVAARSRDGGPPTWDGVPPESGRS
jgi:hypothetical protein